jgi:hypothetical protein
VRWVPSHMMDVLHAFGQHAPLPRQLRVLLLQIVELFETFQKAKEQAGDGWEALFALTLVIRSLSDDFERSIFPLFQQHDIYSVSFNNHFDLPAGDPNGASLDSYLRAISLPPSFPHISINMPQHAKVDCYDLLVAVYGSDQKRTLYGYQLKEGKALPAKESATVVNRSIVIRGSAAH